MAHFQRRMGLRDLLCNPTRTIKIASRIILVIVPAILAYQADDDVGELPVGKARYFCCTLCLIHTTDVITAATSVRAAR
jgi:hypothetical protein